MRRLGATLLTGLLLAGARLAEAQGVAELFGKVASTVVVVRANDAGADAQGRVSDIGSGVVVSRDGKIMTAAHLVRGAEGIGVQFLGGRTVGARVVASELAADLSLIQLDQVPAGLQPAKLANSDGVRVGEQVIVVGAPYELGRRLRGGQRRPQRRLVQRPVGPEHGVQGDSARRVLPSHVISKSGGSEGLGFVVTMNTAKQLLLERRSIWSGLEGQLLSDDPADLFNLPPKTSGFLVKTVAPGRRGDHSHRRGHRRHDRGRSGQDSRAHEPARQCGSGDGDGAAGRQLKLTGKMP